MFQIVVIGKVSRGLWRADLLTRCKNGSKTSWEITDQQVATNERKLRDWSATEYPGKPVVRVDPEASEPE